QIRDQVIHSVAQNVLGEMSLLVIRRVHKVIVVAVGVQKLHIDLIDIDLLDRIRRAEAVLEHCASPQVAQLGLDKGAKVAGSAVFDGKYGVQIIVVLDDHAGAQLRGRDRHCSKQSPSK